MYDQMSCDMTKPTKWLCPKRRPRSAWASAQSDHSLRCVLNGWLKIQSFKMRTVKTLIRLGWCRGAQPFYWFCHVVAQILIWQTYSVSSTLNEPAHEIMALSFLHKFILQTRMCSHPGARCLIFGRAFIYFHTSCVLTAKALARLRGCAGSPEPSLVAYVISTILS